MYMGVFYGSMQGTIEDMTRRKVSQDERQEADVSIETDRPMYVGDTVVVECENSDGVRVSFEATILSGVAVTFRGYFSGHKFLLDPTDENLKNTTVETFDKGKKTVTKGFIGVNSRVYSPEKWAEYQAEKTEKRREMKKKRAMISVKRNMNRAFV